MLNMKKTLTKVLEKITAHDVDYIVEQGTSGIWTYRKWNSGVLECWGTSESISKAVTTKYGNGWYASRTTFNFPSSMFTSITMVQATLNDMSGVGNYFVMDAYTVNAISGYVYGIISNTSNVKLSMYGVGKWK